MLRRSSSAQRRSTSKRRGSSRSRNRLLSAITCPWPLSCPYHIDISNRWNNIRGRQPGCDRPSSHHPRGASRGSVAFLAFAVSGDTETGHRQLLSEARCEVSARDAVGAAGPSGAAERAGRVAHAYARRPGVPGRLYAFARLLIVALLRVGFRVRIVGGEQIPADGPAILAPNHKNLLDPFWSSSNAPRNASRSVSARSSASPIRSPARHKTTTSASSLTPSALLPASRITR